MTSETTTPRADADAPAPVGGLDAPARRALARLRRRGWLLTLAGLVVVVPAAGLWLWNMRFHHIGSRVDATVVETERSTFDSVTVEYRLDGRRYRSIVHVDDATKYCRPYEYDNDLDCLESNPVVVVDPSNSGHATIPDETNLSPPAMVVFKVTVIGLVCVVPVIALGWGVLELIRVRRHRRVLREHAWATSRSRARSERTFEVSADGERWQSLTIKFGAAGPRHRIRVEERIELARFGRGRTLVRPPGADVLLTGVLGPVARSAVDSVAQTAGVRGAAAVGERLQTARAFVLVGALLEYDVLDLSGGPLGSITSKNGYRLASSVRSPAGRQILVMRRALNGRWTVSDAAGLEIAGGRKWPGASVIDLGPAAPAVRARSSYRQFEERVMLPTGKRAPSSGTCWTLLDPEDVELARVTTVGSNFVVEVVAELEPDDSFVLMAQTLLVALIVAKKPSNGGG